jgi:hypothetical protein
LAYIGTPGTHHEHTACDSLHGNRVSLATSRLDMVQNPILTERGRLSNTKDRYVSIYVVYAPSLRQGAKGEVTWTMFGLRAAGAEQGERQGQAVVGQGESSRFGAVKETHSGVAHCLAHSTGRIQHGHATQRQGQTSVVWAYLHVQHHSLAAATSAGGLSTYRTQSMFIGTDATCTARGVEIEERRCVGNGCGRQGNTRRSRVSNRH